MFESRDNALKYVLDFCKDFIPDHQTKRYTLSHLASAAKIENAEPLRVIKKDFLDVALQMQNPLVLILEQPLPGEGIMNEAYSP